MQVLDLKTDKPQDMKGWKKWLFAYFLTNIFARTERKLELVCKVKNNILSFELVSW